MLEFNIELGGNSKNPVFGDIDVINNPLLIEKSLEEDRIPVEEMRNNLYSSRVNFLRKAYTYLEILSSRRKLGNVELSPFNKQGQKYLMDMFPEEAEAFYLHKDKTLSIGDPIE